MIFICSTFSHFYLHLDLFFPFYYLNLSLENNSKSELVSLSTIDNLIQVILLMREPFLCIIKFRKVCRLLPFGSKAVSQLWQSKMSPDIAKCSAEDKVNFENHCYMLIWFVCKQGHFYCPYELSMTLQHLSLFILHLSW